MEGHGFNSVYFTLFLISNYHASNIAFVCFVFFKREFCPISIDRHEGYYEKLNYSPFLILLSHLLSSLPLLLLSSSFIVLPVTLPTVSKVLEPLSMAGEGVTTRLQKDMGNMQKDMGLMQQELTQLQTNLAQK